MALPDQIAELKKIATDITAESRPGWVGQHWKAAHLVLKRTPLDQMRVGRIINARDNAQLAKLIEELETGAFTPPAKPGPRPMVTTEALGALRSALNQPTPSETAASEPAPASAPTPSAQAPAADAPATLMPHGSTNVDDHTLRSALKAFKKRLKASQLDEDSKLSNRALTGGGGARIQAIQPPNTFAMNVWHALAERGCIKREGAGLYRFVKDL
jgi:hypothetical protein